jgi:hypothetical protein
MIMSTENKQLDNFYREALSGHSETASGYTWLRLKWRLLWINYGRIAYGTLLVMLIGSVAIIGIRNISHKDAVPPETQVVSEPMLTPTLTKETTKQTNNVAPITNKETAIAADAGLTGIEQAPAPESNQMIVTGSPGEPIGNNAVAIVPEQSETTNTFEKDLLLMTLHNRSVEQILLVEDDASLSQATEVAAEIKTPHDVPLKKTWVTLGGYVAPAYNFYRLKTDDDAYASYRKDHEKPAISWSTGAELRLNIKNWYVQSGLGYSVYRLDRNYNYSFKALDSLNSYFQTDTIWGWVFDPPEINKPIVMGYDTVFMPVYNEINEGQNEWHYLEIPLLAGYRLNTGRFSFELATGFSWAFLLYSSGNVPSLEQENLFAELDSTPLSDHLFSYLLQAGFSYHLTPAWSLNISPWYKHNLNSVFEDNYPVDQRFNAIGVNFGLRVDL